MNIEILNKIENHPSTAELRRILSGNNSDIIKVTRTLEDSRLLINYVLHKSTHSALIVGYDLNRYLLNYIRSIVALTPKSKFTEISKQIEAFGFKRVIKPTQPGEYAIKGDTILIWNPLYDNPIRISFWGDDIETIETYDELYSNRLEKLDYFAIGNISFAEDTIDLSNVKIHFYTTPLKLNAKIVYSNKDSDNTIKNVNYDFSLPPLFFSRLDLFENEIKQKLKSNWTIAIYSKHFKDIDAKFEKYFIKDDFKSGFVSNLSKFAVYTDRELFGTLFLKSEIQKQQQQVNRFLAAFEGEIQPGDYLVHEDYGIAKYNGLIQKESLGEVKDFLILEYAKKDTLYVPINQVNKLTKYVGDGDNPPVLTRLGKNEWENTKKKAYKSINILASSLIKHYAMRELSNAKILSENNELEHEFAQKFEFEETPDQHRTIKEVLNDLAKEKPMNRMLIGDVGFGKTEVAMRAAFRSVINEKQVFVLCPTTVLVSQHYNVFKHRFQDYAVNIQTLSRFNTSAENSAIVKSINEGKVDIVIGTHRLLTSDIKAKDLGLVIIDEEQKFGVRQKEKIKQIEYGVHVLNMSATPIPRSLSISLSGIYDISLITTPPPGRKQIDTSLEYMTWPKVVDAIEKETKRGGQVYFVHNNVKTIASVKSKLTELMPHLKFEIAHGQMHPSLLDKVMHNFYEHKFDVLISTTIIENGLDIRNVNSIILHKAQNFGLAQMYQLRGRVGRSDKKAYCYLFYTISNLFSDDKLPENEKFEELDLVEDKSNEAKKHKKFMEASREVIRQRLQTMMDTQELGSGFKIASRDLEIRGAGNLLGHEQHGHISKIGFGLYSQLLSQAVEKMKASQEILSPMI